MSLQIPISLTNNLCFFINCLKINRHAAIYIRNFRSVVALKVLATKSVKFSIEVLIYASFPGAVLIYSISRK